MFQSWTGQCFNYMLMMILFPLAFSMFIQVLNDTVFAAKITMAKSAMVFIIFVAMILLSVQIPALCAALSGGASPHGVMGHAFSMAKALKPSRTNKNNGGNNGGNGKEGGKLERLRSLGKGNVKPG